MPSDERVGRASCRRGARERVDPHRCRLTSLGAFRIFLWRWRPDRRDGTKRRFPFVSAAVLGLAAGYLWFVGIRHPRLEARLNEVASTLAGTPVTVDCETPVVLGFTDNEGEAWFPGGVPENRTMLRKGA